MSTTIPLLLTIDDAAEVLGVSRSKFCQMDKAGQISGLTGIQLGALVSIIETSGPLPLKAGFAESRVYALAADVSTPISPGEQSVIVTVQGVFAIE